MRLQVLRYQRVTLRYLSASPCFAPCNPAPTTFAPLIRRIVYIIIGGRGMKTKVFTYPLFADGNNETDILEQQMAVVTKIRGVFNVVNISTIRHLTFPTLPPTHQMRQTLVIEAPACFTKEAIYTIMNSIKPQHLEFRP